MNVMQATAAGCFPLMPVTGQSWCTHVVDAAYDNLDALHLDTIIVTARWNDGAVDADLASTISALKKHARRVIVLGPAEEYSAQLPVILARAVISGNSSLAQQHLDTSLFGFDARVRAVTEQAGGEFVSLLDNLCPDQVCQTFTPAGQPILGDTDHYSAAGAVVAMAPVVSALSAS